MSATRADWMAEAHQLGRYFHERGITMPEAMVLMAAVLGSVAAESAKDEDDLEANIEELARQMRTAAAGVMREKDATTH